MKKSAQQHRQPNQRKWLKARRRAKKLARLTSAEREHRSIQKAAVRHGENVRKSVQEGRAVRISRAAWDAVQRYLLDKKPEQGNKIPYKPPGAARGG